MNIILLAVRVQFEISSYFYYYDLCESGFPTLTVIIVSFFFIDFLT